MEIQLEVIYSGKRRTIAIQVHPDLRVRILAPKWTSRQKIDAIFREKQSWIEKKLSEFKGIKPHKKPQNIFPLLGVAYKIEVLEGRKSFVKKEGGVIIVQKTAKQKMEDVLLSWLKKFAKEVFLERLKVNFEIFSKQFKYPLPSLEIRKMKARWGSMSCTGKMKLNIFLASTPIYLIDYVIMHELCHLKHKNHGKRFYELQEKFAPNYKDLKRELAKFNLEFQLI
jgi:predicted metal-dependent hydrolase